MAIGLIAVTRPPGRAEIDLYWAEEAENAIQRLPFIKGVEDYSAKLPVWELGHLDKHSLSWQRILVLRQRMLSEIEEFNELTAASYNRGDGYPSDEAKEWTQTRGISKGEFDSLVNVIQSDIGVRHFEAKPFARCGHLIVSRLDYAFESDVVLHPQDACSMFFVERQFELLQRELGPIANLAVLHRSGEPTEWREVIPARLPANSVDETLPNVHFANVIGSAHIHLSAHAWEVVGSLFKDELIAAP